MIPQTKRHKFVIDESQQGTRLDHFISTQLPEHSRSFFQRLAKTGKILVNGKTAKPAYKLTAGDAIQIQIPAPEPTLLQPENIPIVIVYEDEHLIVVNKPAGQVVHPGAGVRSGTLVNALLHHCKDLSGVGGRMRPGIVHRLDKNTSGLLVVAKNDATHIALQKQFSEKTAHREYRALIWGNLKAPEGKLETLLNRSKSDRKKFVVAETGKHAVTLYQVETYFQFLTLLKVWLKTGRTHQIRVHFNHLNHPVFGDPEYSGRQKQIKRLSALSDRKLTLNLLSIMKRQALHAYRLIFEHPAKKKEMEFVVELPKDFQQIIDILMNEG